MRATSRTATALSSTSHKPTPRNMVRWTLSVYAMQMPSSRMKKV